MPRRARTRRDAPSIEPRSLARFRREVVALLMVGHKIHPEHGLRLIKKWDRYVRARHRQGWPPCKVSDHIAKFEKEGLITAKKVAADADNPSKGEVFETRRGDRWRIVNVREDGKVDVERAGHRQSGALRWAKSVLKHMKESKAPASTGLGTGLFSSEPVAPDPEARTWIRRKIRLLIDEGYSPKQAVAIAYRMSRSRRRKTRRSRKRTRR